MDNGLALIIVAIITIVPAVIHEMRLGRVARKLREVGSDVKEVKLGVDTFNETTIGQNSANQLTDDIEAKPYAERTAQEQRHLDAAPPRDPPQDPQR